MTDRTMYGIWYMMIRRCTNKDDPSYDGYGGRGISVCTEWQVSLDRFCEDMGPRPGPEFSLDRIDVNGNYEPANCRWATIEEQNNNKRNNFRLAYGGREQTLPQWAAELGIKPHTIRARIEKCGWSVEQALGFAKPPKRPPPKTPVKPHVPPARTLTYNGETLTLDEWSARTGINKNTLRNRLFRCGWSVEKAFTTPIDVSKRR